MRELTAKEKDLLDRIRKKPHLEPFFFRKARGLHWFDPLKERGYFSPERNPKPIPAHEDGYVNIPSWAALEYLVSTSLELNKATNNDYIVKFLEIVREVTRHAQTQHYSNYHTWWQFSKIMSQIPVNLIERDDIGLFDYWLDNPHDRGLVAEQLGTTLLPKLLAADEVSNALALMLIDKMFTVQFVEKKFGSIDRNEAILRVDSPYAYIIIKAIAVACGKQHGIRVVRIFESKLVTILDKLNNDAWSYIWRPAIEEHPQNTGTDKTEHVILTAFRDYLAGMVENDLAAARGYLRKLLSGTHDTLKRVAIHAVSQKFDQLNTLSKDILLPENFSENLRHEIWHFLKCNYGRFDAALRKKTFKLIESLKVSDGNGVIKEMPTAHRRSAWLSSIKDEDKKAGTLYQKYIGITKNEPRHADFPFFMGPTKYGWESPIPIEKLIELSITELIEQIVFYEDTGHLTEPDFTGLAKAFRQVVRSRAHQFFLELDRFLNVDLAFIYELLEGYHELWNENSPLQWQDVWPRLMDFCAKLTDDMDFWSVANAKERQSFVANRHWIVGSIARLIEDGTKSDEHAFDPSLLSKAKEILVHLLTRQKGEMFSNVCDAVSLAINSPRGQCLEALINHSLRSCRLAEKEKKDHSAIWKEYQTIYDAELGRNEIGEYEFATLVAHYLPNFRYMSKAWLYQNLSRIFDQSAYQKWLCAMQGYAHVNTIDEDVYEYLKDHGDFLKTLDDANLASRIKEKVIQNIVVCYLNNKETLDAEHSVIRVLLERAQFEELQHVVWFIWTQRDKDQPALSAKVYELWPKLLELVDFETNEGRKLASSLCHWAVFIDEITTVNRNWLLRVAPYANEQHNSYDLIRNLARISNSQPFDAQRIWLEMLSSYCYEYPEEAIKQILSNLLAKGTEGKRKAKEIADAYLRHGTERPRIWLNEINEQLSNQKATLNAKMS